MATFAISDIHGRIHELERLMTYMGCSKLDTLVFLGDYIDKGPHANAVIQKLIHLAETMPNAHFLKGNHEEMAIRAKVDSDVRAYWLKYGGDKTLESYPNGISREHWCFMYQLKPYLETDEAIFMHASLDEHTPMARQDSETLFWKRLSQPLRHYTGKKIYCGHSSLRSGYPALFGHARCIDSSGWLTAINVDTDHVYQVNAAACQREFNINDCEVFA